MGWNFAFGSLTGATLDDLADLGITTTGAATSGDLAIEEWNPHVAVRDGQLVFACTETVLIDLLKDIARQRDVRAIAVVFGSAADVHQLWMRDGGRERELAMMAGEVLEEDGSQWPEELAAFAEHSFAEDAFADTFERVSGVTPLDDEWFDWEVVWQGHTDVYYTDLAAPEVNESSELSFDDYRRALRSSKVVAAVLGFGILVELVFGFLALARGQSFGLLVPHAAFTLLAAVTIHSGRKDSQRTLWTAFSAGILLISVLITVGTGGDHRGVLMVFATYLVVTIGILIGHAMLLRKIRRVLNSVG